MKRLSNLFGLVLLIFLLFGCTKKSLDDEVNVLMPSGGPALGFAHMIHTVDKIENKKVNYEVTSLATELPAAITSKDYPIVIAPTNIGANLYNKDSNYVYAGAITFGNLFLVGKTNDVNLDKQTIVAFGEGSIPQILLEKILVYKGYSIVDEIDQNSNQKQVSITYFDSVTNANSQFALDDYQYALLAEPVLSVTKTKKDIYTIIDIQEEYKDMTDVDSYPQAGIFIDQNFINKNEAFVTSFLEKVKASTEFVNTNKEDTANYYALEKITPELPKTVLIDSITGSNISFKSAQESKQELTNFLELIYEFKPALIGGKLPDDDFYFG